MNNPATEPVSLADWLSYLEALHPQTIEMGLERIKRVQAELGLYPRFPIIIVGGTNGKGSVCTMLESILHCAGYKTGCYTSPHLLRYNERIRIDRHDIDDTGLCEIFAQIDSARKRCGISLTYFEFGTLAAVCCFMGASVDAAILEVGLGGRLDAVNIFDADCAILTSIDLDHIEYLGETREAIGFEKAAIFRKNKPAICAETDLPQSVVDQVQQIGARCYRIDQEFGYRNKGGHWDYWSTAGTRRVLPWPALRGEKQLQNASACLAALDMLHALLPVTMHNIREGLLTAVIPGRFQVISTQPLIVLDVAHNPGAARVLSRNLHATQSGGRTFAVFSMLGDKDIQGVIRELMSDIDCWLVAGIQTQRAAAVEFLIDQITAAGVTDDKQKLRFDSCTSAFAFACEQAAKNDRICVFGSFYTVSDVLRYWNTVQSKK
ncbi:MAG: bifunctional tetrahydrofolate synthase/dihydrofolate synthase [Nitrosomonas sp.]|nr:MAG: bifunctional tetrahydrofolate synthase/dihydrofolate synthase [Nitrosomonas sp.]